VIFAVWQNRRMSEDASRPRVARHADPIAFLAAAAPVFARDDALASSYVAFATGLLRNPPGETESVYLATYADVGAAMMRGSGGLWVGASDADAAIAFADDVYAYRGGTQVPLQGVVGIRSACDAFAQRWRTLTGRAHQLRVQLRNHRLTRVEAVPRPAGASRRATADDIDWVSAAQHDFIMEIQLPDDAARLRALIPRRIEQGQIWIWDDAGAVAFAGWTDAPPDAARIAPVYTPPLARGRGYATALVAELSQALLDQGRPKLFLITDLANPVSNSIYARIGYRPLSDIFHFDFVDAMSDAGVVA
jgi:GNAT superfamily N-acetyltransferase